MKVIKVQYKKQDSVKKSYQKESRYLSYLLRHNPRDLDLTMDEHGWVSVSELVNHSKEKLNPFTMEMIQEIVTSDSKQRYALVDGKIRANQGHSFPVDLELTLVKATMLYHGTADRFSESIEQKGLLKQTRQYVHLTDDFDTAVKTGERHGKPIVYKVDVSDLEIYLSENGVYLVEGVSPDRLVEKYTIEFM